MASMSSSVAAAGFIITQANFGWFKGESPIVLFIVRCFLR